MKKVNVGIVGIVFMGSTHFDIYQKHPNMEGYAIADGDKKKLDGDWSSIIGNIGNAKGGLKNLSRVEKKYIPAVELIKDSSIDLVGICTAQRFGHRSD